MIALNWNFDIATAPRGKMVTQVQSRTKGDVEVTRFVPDKVTFPHLVARMTYVRESSR